MPASLQVLLLLKASDRIAHDLTRALPECNSSDGEPELPIDASLALRKWHSLRPRGEFRCFVKAHDLVGTRLFSQSFHASVPNQDSAPASVSGHGTQDAASRPNQAQLDLIGTCFKALFGGCEEIIAALRSFVWHFTS